MPSNYDFWDRTLDSDIAMIVADLREARFRHYLAGQPIMPRSVNRAYLEGAYAMLALVDQDTQRRVREAMSKHELPDFIAAGRQEIANLETQIGRIESDLSRFDDLEEEEASNG